MVANSEKAARPGKKPLSRSNAVPCPTPQEQKKIDAFFREAHQKIASEIVQTENLISLSLSDFAHCKHTIHAENPSDKHWYVVLVRIEIPGSYIMQGTFGITDYRTVETIREPYLSLFGEGGDALGLPRSEWDSLTYAPPRSLLHPSSDVIIRPKVQDLARYCRLLALKEFLQLPTLRSGYAESSRPLQPGTKLGDLLSKMRPDLASRRALVAQNLQKSNSQLCGLFDLAHPAIPLPEGWAEDFEVRDWRSAYRNPTLRQRIHRQLGNDRRMVQTE